MPRVVPAYFRIAQIAPLSGMSTRTLRGMLKSSCGLVRHGKAHYRVSASQLREAAPELYERIYAALLEDEP